MPTPYSGSCGAKMRSMPAPTACWSVDRPGASSAITGSARTTTSNAAGTSTTSTQVSSADAVAPTAARSSRSRSPASSGTTSAASAPPATISKMMLGMLFAVWYMSARCVYPTVLPRTSVRANPATRLRSVSTAMSAAARAMRVVVRVLTVPSGSLREPPWCVAFPRRRAPRSRRRRGPLRSWRAAAQRVQFAQAGRALDDLGEADLLAGRGEAGEPGEQQRPPDRPGTGGERHAEERAERVRARVAEHDLLAEVGREQGGGGTDRTGGDPTERRADQHARLQRPTRAQVEQVDQIRCPGDDARAEQRADGAAPAEGVSGSGAQAGDQRGTGQRAAAGAEGGGCRGGDGERRSTREAHGAPPEVGAVQRRDRGCPYPRQGGAGEKCAEGDRPHGVVFGGFGSMPELPPATP